MPRQARQYSETGIYHVMLRGNEKKDIFAKDEDKQKFIEILFTKKEKKNFLLYCYCIMNNHVHLVIKEEEENVSQIIKKIATSYASYYNKKHRRIGHVFQDRFKSEPIDTENYLLAVIRYVHKNPQKAGIGKLEDYQWSSYKSYVDKNVKLPEIKEILSYFSNDFTKAQKEFEDFSHNQEGNSNEFLDVENSKPITEVNFSKHLLNLLNKYGLKSKQDLTKNENKTQREEIIKELVEKSDLSLRQIAEFSGVNRETVRKIGNNLSR